MPEHFDDFPVLAGLGTSLRAAMADAEAAEATAAVPGAATPVDAAPERDRHTRRWRRGPRNFGALSSILVLGVVGTAAAAATLTVLRGSPIPAPRAADLQPAMTAKAETQRVLDLRAADPSGGGIPPYALRIGESQGGLTCVTVGQVDGDQFGIVGTDRRFRNLPPTLIDGCGQETGSGPAVAGARVLDATNYGDVRTVVYGVGNSELEAAALEIRGVARKLEVKDGAFLTVVPGYPEDSALTLRLTYEDGHTATHPLGASPLTALDPEGPAWRVETSVGMGPSKKGAARVCVSVRAARSAPKSPSSPPACALGRGPASGLQRDRWFFDIRTLGPGDQGSFDRDRAKWFWHDSPARTVVWGSVQRERVANISVHGPAGLVREQKPSINGGFAFVLDASVPASALTVVMTTKDGREHRFDRPQLPIGRIDS